MTLFETKNMKFPQITVLLFSLILCLSVSAQERESKIRAVGFADFTYPWLLPFGDPDESFTLKNGELPPTYDKRGIRDEVGIYFGRVHYGDVTGDGAEEAFVFLSVQTGGSSIPGILYIYTWQNNHPKLLWSRSTGDRADGGLRDAYAEDGNFILELNSSEGKRGDCCPIKFERIKYKWNGKKFRQKQKEVLPIPESRKSNGGIEPYNGRESETTISHCPTNARLWNRQKNVS
jgi:hypothetical protein